MGDVEISRGEKAKLGKVEGNLRVDKYAIIEGEGTPPELKVSGDIICNKNCVFNCNVSSRSFLGKGDVEVKGNLRAENSIRIERGSLRVDGTLEAREVDVDKQLVVSGNLDVEDSVDIGGYLRVDGQTKARSIDVGGSFKSGKEVEAEEIDIGGSFRAEGKKELMLEEFLKQTMKLKLRSWMSEAPQLLEEER